MSECKSKYASRPIFYTDSIGGSKFQVNRDDLWAVTTEELNETESLRAEVQRLTEELEEPDHGEMRASEQWRQAFQGERNRADKAESELSALREKVERMEGALRLVDEAYAGDVESTKPSWVKACIAAIAASAGEKEK